MIPPSAPATTIEDASSSSSPYRRNCRASTHPAMTNARNIIKPKVVISKLPTLISVGHMRAQDNRALRRGLLERRLLIGDEAEHLHLPRLIEMLRDLEELHGEERIQSVVQHRLPLLERQLGDVGDEHVLVEAAVLIEEHT